MCAGKREVGVQGGACWGATARIGLGVAEGTNEGRTRLMALDDTGPAAGGPRPAPHGMSARVAQVAAAPGCSRATSAHL